ncbi:MAG: PIG-L family deacetylase [Gemmataceae bacterium]|nr:PIG-L family deacetylase [Gemmataceae bacterium]
MRAFFRWLYQARMSRRQREWSEADLARPSVVFAPHPDDEALGCGGTIIRKRRAGAPVHLVFMTDGSQSHAHLMPPEQLSALRREEARAAARTLGVAPEDVAFLDYPDGKLTDCLAAGTARVAEILRHKRPAQVFATYHRDPPPDHRATTRIVLEALKHAGSQATVCEYPIWFWDHWPWTPLRGGLRERWRTLQEGRYDARQLRRECQSWVRISDVLDQKRAALEQHRSQMRRLIDDPRWLTLPDAGGGDWLKCFFGDREIFCEHPA